MFLDMAVDKSKVESTLRLTVDTTIVSDIDIHRIMFVFDWFVVNIFDHNFAWSTFTRSVYVADKRDRVVLKHAPYSPTPVASLTTPISSTIDFSTDVLAADAKHQAKPAVPGTVATSKSHNFGRLPLQQALARSTHTRFIAHIWYLHLPSHSMSTNYTESWLPLQSHMRST
jgi:hypothetical protein